jgi:hypothetical protein
MGNREARFLERVSMGSRNPAARNRNDEYRPEKQVDYDDLHEQDKLPWYEQPKPEVVVRFPGLRGKRPGKVREVWFK